TFGRMFGLIDAEQFEGAFRRWVGSVLPALGAENVRISSQHCCPLAAGPQQQASPQPKAPDIAPEFK
ncbi:MAG: hypothetical protein ACYDBH_17655, partial [Acidobacteriaceae bacterium]